GALHVRVRDPEQRSEAQHLLSQALEVPVDLESDPAALSSRVSDPERVAHALSELGRSGIAVTNFALGQPSLDEVFLALTGRPAEESPVEEVPACPPQMLQHRPSPSAPPPRPRNSRGYGRPSPPAPGRHGPPPSPRP